MRRPAKCRNSLLTDAQIKVWNNAGDVIATAEYNEDIDDLAITNFQLTDDGPIYVTVESEAGEVTAGSYYLFIATLYSDPS